MCVHLYLLISVCGQEDGKVILDFKLKMQSAEGASLNL